MARSGLRQQLFSTELYLKDTKRPSIRDVVGAEPADLGCLASHMAKTESKHSLPFFIKFLPEQDVVSQSGIEDPGLLGHVSKGSTGCDAALQECHLRRQTPSNGVIMQNHHPKPTEPPTFHREVGNFGNFLGCFLDPKPDFTFVPQSYSSKEKESLPAGSLKSWEPSTTRDPNEPALHSAAYKLLYILPS